MFFLHTALPTASYFAAFLRLVGIRKDGPAIVKHMRIGKVTSEFMNQGKELLRRLRTTEANMLTDAEIRMLRLQLHLLDIEASNRNYTIHPSVKLPACERLLASAQAPDHAPFSGDELRMICYYANELARLTDAQRVQSNGKPALR